MSRAQRKNPRWGGEPKSFTRQQLHGLAEVIRELLAEVDQFCVRMDERGIKEVVLPAGKGGGGYERAEKAVNAWISGLRNALREKIRAHPDGER